ncbi:serine/threonine protein kinase [Kitasatospora sp. MAA4]|uniref:serine/threonine-protein kinase n=1 Tax=Kitasatospora sp. MAA4 TaxID=3035093 RepID=UPI0024762FB0|nr:serine/threonine-protein kinase [Kitasatospora sp. MAA4]MDH6135153.1 serine/threonine protein kinase [Kitasatospora sp. MAA4]
MQGTRLAGRYHLVERLAGGPMGELWAAQDAVLGRDVAVRILKPTLPADPDFAARFHAEARLLARLRHPGVVQIHDFGHSSTQDGTPVAYLVMDLIRGEALSALLDRRGPLEPAQALRLMSQVLTVLGTAHSAGVVHRDLKPSNLLLCEGTVVLTGFGIAPLGHDDTASGADDLYALGVVLHECLTGRLPVRSTLGAELPGPVRALVATALAEDPARRWPDAATMAAACELTLAAVLAQDPAEPAPARPVSSRGAARHRRVPRLLRGRGRLLLAVGLALRSLS